MYSKLALTAYNIAFTLALPLVFLRLFLRGCRLPAYRNRWLERLGWFKAPGTTGGIWVHAVSVGESAAAVPIIEALLKKNPQMPVTVTTTTPTGSQRVRQALGDKVFHVYCPYDLPWCIYSFLKRVQPEIVLIMETELWPNLLNIVKRKNIPVILANARLSPNSFKGYQRFVKFTQRMLDNVSVIAAQSATDADRFALLSGTQDKVHVTGNVKYDIALTPTTNPDAQILSLKPRHIWIAASTHANEEQQVLQAHMALLKIDPTALLILVPRHPDRFAEVEKLLIKDDFNYVKRSQGDPVLDSHNVLLGDTMGELATLYAQVKIAFVGGSLVPVGGHNLLEPASLGLPILSGPFLHNFKAVSEALNAKEALWVIKDATQLGEAVVELWAQSEQCQKMGQQALSVVRANQGAVKKTIAFVEAQLSQTRSI